MKKGYTLIELLATIAVLAIVSLIAFPKITDAIEKAKLNSAKASAELYIHALEITYVGNNLKASDKWLSPDIYDAPLDNKYEVKVKGSKPKDGWISVDSHEIDRYSLYIGNYTVNYINDELTVTKGKKIEEKPGKSVVIDLEDIAVSQNIQYTQNLELPGLKANIGIGSLQSYSNKETYCLKIYDYTTDSYVDFCDLTGKNNRAAYYILARNDFNADYDFSWTDYIYASNTMNECEYEAQKFANDYYNSFGTSYRIATTCYKYNKLFGHKTSNVYYKTEIDKEGRVKKLKVCLNDKSEICFDVESSLSGAISNIKKYSNFDETKWNILDVNNENSDDELIDILNNSSCSDAKVYKKDNEIFINNGTISMVNENTVCGSGLTSYIYTENKADDYYKALQLSIDKIYDDETYQASFMYFSNSFMYRCNIDTKEKNASCEKIDFPGMN